MRLIAHTVSWIALLACSAAVATAANATRQDDYFTTSDGVKIHYITLGGHGSWVVLIHGFTDTAQRMFISTGIAEALATNHRVVALDNRNHGQSDKPQPNGPGRAEDTIELMDHLGIQKAHIHGYSMGGGITGQLLASHPERFITAAFGGSGIQETDEELRKKAAAMDTPMPPPQGAEKAAFDRLRAIATARATATGGAPPARPALKIDLTTVTIPVLAINGEWDSPHAKTERMTRELKNFQNVILPGKNHMSAIAVGGPMPQLYIDSLVHFINAHDASGLELGGVSCQNPSPSHCPDANCPGPMVIEQGAAIEPKTGRKFFLDYPCDLQRGEKVTFVLSLHGAGSYGNWQRHYFPIMDYATKYRLVIATPNAPPKVWAPADDEYLQNVVSLVYEQVGKENIKAFWLVGHSQGGMTSNRLVRTDFFQQRVAGWLSLSGGRLGGSPGRASSFGPPRTGAAATPAARSATTSGIAAAMATLREPPSGDFSFIYETGEHEMDDKGVPETSAWAAKYGCGQRVRQPDVVDTKPGYVYDSTRQDPGSDAWGRLPRPGTAQVFEYPNCKDGRVVADVVRIGKGHTEGLEPRVTERLIQLMLSAKN